MHDLENNAELLPSCARVLVIPILVLSGWIREYGLWKLISLYSSCYALTGITYSTHPETPYEPLEMHIRLSVRASRSLSALLWRGRYATLKLEQLNGTDFEPFGRCVVEDMVSEKGRDDWKGIFNAGKYEPISHTWGILMVLLRTKRHLIITYRFNKLLADLS